MDGATDPIVSQRLHLQLFEDDTLTCESSITVNDNWDYRFSVLFIATHRVLNSSNSAHNNRVDRLQVTRVGQQRNRNFFTLVTVARLLHAGQSCSQMILDITSVSILVLDLILGNQTLELSHNHFHGLAHHIC